MEQKEILAGLETCGALGGGGPVEVIHTALNTVMLAGDRVYKFKKPASSAFFDFSTLDLRQHYCEREVELNRRLSPEVYLGVSSVTADGDGVSLDGPGEPLEYAVKMLRLPAERMMDMLLRDELVTPAHIDEIAAVVARFHAGARADIGLAAHGDPQALRGELDDDLSQLAPFEGATVERETVADLRDYFHRWLDDHDGLLRQRARDGRIRDCHGDMHSRNICLPGGVVIFDCIEFNDSFRYIDVAREVAFLAMDLDSFDQPGLAKRYVERYVELSGDGTLADALEFYKAWLATVRGKVYSLPAGDEEISPQERKSSAIRARRYFELAHRYTGARPRPLILVMMGVMGSGKSLLAKELAGTMQLHVMDSDFVRKSLAGVAPEERRRVGFGEDIYSPEMTERVYDAMARAAESMAAAGYSVILDASFARSRHRRAIVELAQRQDAVLLFVECTASRDVLAGRLTAREREGKGWSDGRLELLQKQVDSFEAPDELGDLLFVLDTDAPPSELAADVEARVEESYARQKQSKPPSQG